MTVTLIVAKRTYGFQARHKSCGPGQTKLFSIQKYGYLKAKALAEKYDEKFKKEAATGKQKLHCNNKSGVNGFRVEWREYKDNGNFFPYIIVSTIWCKGSVRLTSRSIDKHGFDKALKELIKIRAKNTDEDLDFIKIKKLLMIPYLLGIRIYRTTSTTVETKRYGKVTIIARNLPLCQM